jgi:cell wall-associated NlpC family hydrolase
MKSNVFILITLVALSFASCRSIRKITDKDVTTSTKATKKAPRSKKPEFIEGIEVTPGATVNTKQKTGVTSKKNDPNETTKQTTKTKGSDIEKANYLQIKYAVLLDMAAEELTNIALLQVIDKWWGTKYCLGGSTDNCIDCSAFTQIIMKDVYGVSLPRTSQEQFTKSEKIELADLKEGDLVFFNTSGRNISHVGVYIANNKFVHASTSGGVTITDLNDRYWQPRFRAAGKFAK